MPWTPAEAPPGRVPAVLPAACLAAPAGAVGRLKGQENGHGRVLRGRARASPCALGNGAGHLPVLAPGAPEPPGRAGEPSTGSLPALGRETHLAIKFLERKGKNPRQNKLRFLPAQSPLHRPRGGNPACQPRPRESARPRLWPHRRLPPAGARGDPTGGASASLRAPPGPSSQDSAAPVPAGRGPAVGSSCESVDTPGSGSRFLERVPAESCLRSPNTAQGGAVRTGLHCGLSFLNI